MVYLSYNDPPTGVYRSQVIDVCDYLSKELDTPTTLVSMISPRLKGDMTDYLQDLYQNHRIINSWAGSSRWRLNASFAAKFVKKLDCEQIIARGPIACRIALNWRDKGWVKKVCYDGRGAYWAESQEFPDSHPAEPDELFQLEEDSVSKSDFRISVSNALIDYWKEKYNYSGNEHVIIPCTLPRNRNTEPPTNRQELRNKFGFSEQDIVLVYAGSSAGWQALQPLNDWLVSVMKANENVKLLMLVPRVDEKMTVFKDFPDRCKRDWVKPHEVRENLACGDYGLLMRLPVITNKVSAPVKFAEYLDAGLKVMITPDIGDYSEYVKKEKCGTVCGFNEVPELSRPTREETLHSFELSQRDFTKKGHREEYEKVLKALSI